MPKLKLDLMEGLSSRVVGRMGYWWSIVSLVECCVYVHFYHVSLLVGMGEVTKYKSTGS